MRVKVGPSRRSGPRPNARPTCRDVRTTVMRIGPASLAAHCRAASTHSDGLVTVSVVLVLSMDLQQGPVQLVRMHRMHLGLNLAIRPGVSQTRR